MNARILRAVIVIAPWILGRWVLRDIQQPLSRIDRRLTITPVTISASRRDYPSVVENRGKGFLSSLIREGDPKGGGFTGKIFTARHVISDSGYNYVFDRSIALSALYQLSGDLASAEFSGQIATGSSFRYTSGLLADQVLMAQYRNDNRDWLTGSIVSSGNIGVTIDLPVIAGDSGSPVIFADRSLGVVSQSVNSDQGLVILIK